MALTERQIKDVCDIYGGSNRCRYMDEELVDDDNGDFNIVYVCRKKSPDKNMIDQHLVSQINDCKLNGTDPHQAGISMGDNCDGFVVLKTKPQGYDVKKT